MWIVNHEEIEMEEPLSALMAEYESMTRIEISELKALLKAKDKEIAELKTTVARVQKAVFALEDVKKYWSLGG